MPSQKYSAMLCPSYSTSIFIYISHICNFLAIEIVQHYVVSCFSSCILLCLYRISCCMYFWLRFYAILLIYISVAVDICCCYCCYCCCFFHSFLLFFIHYRSFLITFCCCILLNEFNQRINSKREKKNTDENMTHQSWYCIRIHACMKSSPK